MTTALAKQPERIGQFDPNQEITFEVNRDEIERLKEQYLGLTINGIDDREGYDAVHEARMACVKVRTGIEKQRKEYTRAALDYQRSVNAAAKKAIAQIEPIEAHLTEQEDAYKAEVERRKKAAEEAKQKILQDRLDQLQAVGCVMNQMVVAALDSGDFADLLSEKTEAYRIKQEQEAKAEAERKRIEAEEAAARKAEADRLEAERKAIEAERAELDRLRKAEQDRIDAERKEIEAEKERLAQEERERQEAAHQEQEAIKRQRELEAAKEQARIDAERRIAREKEEAERKAAEEKAAQERKEALRPDREKLLAIADRVQCAADGIEVSREAGKLLSRLQSMCQLRAESLRDEIRKWYETAPESSDEEE